MSVPHPPARGSSRLVGLQRGPEPSAYVFNTGKYNYLKGNSEWESVDFVQWKVPSFTERSYLSY